MFPRHYLSFCACTTACLASQSLVSMGPSPHLWFLLAKQRLLDQTYKSLRVPDLTCRFVHAKQHAYHQNYYSLRVPALMSGFLDAKERLMGQNNKSLWVPDITCRFVHANQRDLSQNNKSICQPSSVFFFSMQNSAFRTSLTSLYGSQTSSVVLSTHNSVLSARINRLSWFQLSPAVLCIQNSDFRTRITSLCGSKTPPVVFACKTATSGPE